MGTAAVLGVSFLVETSMVPAQAVCLHSCKYPNIEDSNTFDCTMYRAVSNARCLMVGYFWQVFVLLLLGIFGADIAIQMIYTLVLDLN